jgi:hypothetical protein
MIMRAFAMAAVLLGFAATNAVAASTRVSDVDYLKANRCKGLAASSIGAGVDVAGLDAFLRVQQASRPEAIREKADEIQARAKREAERNGDAPRLTAELNGPCKAYFNGASSVAGSPSSQPAT